MQKFEVTIKQITNYLVEIKAVDGDDAERKALNWFKRAKDRTVFEPTVYEPEVTHVADEHGRLLPLLD